MPGSRLDLDLISRSALLSWLSGFEARHPDWTASLDIVVAHVSAAPGVPCAPAAALEILDGETPLEAVTRTAAELLAEEPA